MKKISKSIQTSKKKMAKKNENQTTRNKKDSWLESFSQFNCSSSNGKNSWFDFAKQEKYIKA